MKEQNTNRKELELYFHIPFCIRKCFYCDFLSAPGEEETKKRYMEALLTETVGSAFRYEAYRVRSVFIGGGTPSVVPPACIGELMAAVREHYDLAKDVEVTIEVNPGTVTKTGLACYRKAGINRISMGLQSGDNRELAAMGRIHTWQQFLESFRAAREVGFDNINVDIMSALPGQTLSGYRHTLEKVLALEVPPEHISAYSLILEEGTPFYEMAERGELEFPDEETDRRMYQETKRILVSHGYTRYEISNYAKPGYACRHNCSYWQRKNYAGFGIGAASLVENVRFCNGRDLKTYLDRPLECGEDMEVLSRQEQMEEFMFLGLRMTEGVSCEAFAQLFGCSLEAVYGDVIRKNVRDGLLGYYQSAENWHSGNKGEMMSGTGKEIRESQGGRGQETKGQNRKGCTVRVKDVGDRLRLALTDRGLDLSNYVMAQFLI